MKLIPAHTPPPSLPPSRSHLTEYKDYHDITSTGDSGISLFPGGVLQEDKVRVLSRIYAEAVAGEVRTMKFHEEKSEFDLVYTPNEGLANDPDSFGLLGESRRT